MHYLESLLAFQMGLRRKQRPHPESHCEKCGKMYYQLRTNQFYCSRKCLNRAYRDRVKLALAVGRKELGLT